MRRRNFITLLAAPMAWPLAAHAQQQERMRRIGVLMGFAESDEVWQSYLASFKRALQELGWTEGRNLRIYYRWAGESAEHTRMAADELVALGPDLLFVTTNPALSAVMQATRQIPIVFTWVSDSVGSGFVASLARPGGNVTGFHNFEPSMGGKWLEVLREVAPDVRRVAVLYVPEVVANIALLHAAEAASSGLGVSVVPAAVRNASDVEQVLTAFAREPNGGLVVTPSPLTGTRRDVIIEMAARERLPTVYGWRDFVSAGGLMSYGPNVQIMVRKAAVYVDRIIKGEQPGNLPVEQPARLELALNLTTAKALEISIPSALLARADEVIE